MPRAIWTGSISFGLVNVPVRMYPAIQEHKLHFHLVHAKDSGPIGYQKICKAEDKPVSDEEIVKAFEYRKGDYVFMSDEDFEQAQAEGHKSIDVTEFVPHEEIEALRASVERTKRGGARRDSSSEDALEKLPKSELEKRARSAGIEGRSRMSKHELVDALRTAA